MGKYFGTDGIRGRANDTLSVEMAYKIGRYLGYYYEKEKESKILIGKDTRLSSTMFENALAAGALESGADVYLLGYTSTPCVSHLVSHKDFTCGIMISASHNPYYDNGIKLFKTDGTKVDSALEDLIEEYFEANQDIPKAHEEKIGRLFNYSEGLELYLAYLEQVATLDLSKFKIAIDLANGSTCYTAKKLLDRFHGTIDYYFNAPDGLNINRECGSTHLDKLQEIVIAGNYDLGIAFDGDGDRTLLIDHRGNIVDGDAIIYLLAKHFKQLNKLKDNTVVTTVMSNIGLLKALENENINYQITAVGDKYVFEEMKNNNYSLGGEQSGHIIIKEYANSGDGLMTALVILDIMASSKISLANLLSDLVIYPQLLVNVKVKDKSYAENAELICEVEKANQELAGNGRVLIRVSGTEPLIRVMVEAKSTEICQSYVDKFVAMVEENEKRI